MEQASRAVTAWQDSAAAGNAPPLRFPIGTPVECFAGDEGWLRGTVCAHQYREPSWAAEMPTVPYQVLLDSLPSEAGGEPRAMWAPADVEEIVRASFRFELMDVADCRVTQDEWVRCTVVGRYYREKDWEEGTCAPYQVRVDGVLPGCREEKVLSLAAAGDADPAWQSNDSASRKRARSSGNAVGTAMNAEVDDLRIKVGSLPHTRSVRSPDLPRVFRRASSPCSRRPA